MLVIWQQRMENKMPSVSNLVKKADYDTKISEPEKKITDHNHNKYITTPEFNTLTASIFNARLVQEHLITKTDFDAKLSSLNRKITANKTKHLLVENELKKLKTFDSSYIIDKSYFEEDGTQNYLVFQSINRDFKVIANTGYVSSWKSKGLSAESCLKQNSITYTHGKTVKIYIVYEISASSSFNEDSTLKRQASISTDILFMELDLIEKVVFYFQAVDSVKTLE